MKELLKLFFKERVLLPVALVILLIAAALYVSQFVVIAGFGGALSDINVQKQGTQVEDASVPGQTGLADKPLREQASALYGVFKKEGRDGLVNFIIKQKSYYFILFFGILLFAVIFMSQLFLYLKDVSLEYLGISIATRVRTRLFSRMIHLPSSFFKSNKSGDIIARSLQDIFHIQQNVARLLEAFIFGSILVITGSVILFLLNAKFTIILIITGAVAMGVISGLSMVIKRVLRAIRGHLSNIATHIQNVLFGIDIVKIFNREKYEINKFNGVAREFLKSSKKEKAIYYLIRPVTEAFGALALVGVLLFGASQIWADKLDFKEIIHFIVLVMMIAPNVQKLARTLIIWQELSVSMSRLRKVLSSQPEQHKEATAVLEDFKGAVQFDNISFRYSEDETWSLSGISLKADQGSIIAIVGPSGSGKSTLVNLIPAFILPEQGRILFDGVDYRQLGTDYVRSCISLVSQDTILFAGTIFDNIKYGNPEASMEDIMEAARMADIFEFIESLSEGFDSLVGERGIKLSGGQKQRLCIARAILKKPKILLLDEATSALDTQSEISVQRAIENLVHKQTTFVVAHRLSTIKKADLVLVMEHGRIVEQGTPDELLEKGGLFKKLHDLQFKI